MKLGRKMAILGKIISMAVAIINAPRNENVLIIAITRMGRLPV